MKKVKDYLDKYLISLGNSTCKLKSNGHYEVFGNWLYPKNWKPTSIDDVTNIYDNKPLDHMLIQINNETILVGNMSVDGVWSIYHYFQTYEHIPRGEPDNNGYYTRSTEDEIIFYLNEYYQKMKKC